MERIKQKRHEYENTNSQKYLKLLNDKIEIDSGVWGLNIAINRTTKDIVESRIIHPQIFLLTF